MQSVSGAGMIGQWEAGCHRTLTRITHTHSYVIHTNRKERETALVEGGGWREGGKWKRCLSHWDVLFPHEVSEVITSF